MSVQYSIPFPHAVDYSPETLVRHEGVFQAAQVMEAFPAWPTPVLYIWGPARVGKSHLASALIPETPETLDVLDLGAQESLSPQEATDLFHQINHQTANERHLLVLSRVPPAGLHPQLPDLDSRLKAAFAIEIRQPEDEALAAIFLKICADVQLRLSHQVLTYVLSRADRNIQALEGFCHLAAQSSAKTDLTIPIAKALLTQLA